MARKRSKPTLPTRLALRDLRIHQCDNCDRKFAGHELKPVDRLGERVDPDGPTPSGECPACGALAYPGNVTVSLWAPSGKRIVGRCEMIPGTARFALATIHPAGIDPEWSGDTEVHWDGQEAERDDASRELYVDAEGTPWPDEQLLAQIEAV